MKKIILTPVFALAFFVCLLAQTVGIGTTLPNSTAALEIKASNKGLLIPRTSTSSRNTIASPAKGLMLYDTTTSSFCFHNGSMWIQVENSGNNWSLTGNAGTNAAINFIGTTDAKAIIFKVNDIRAGIIDSASLNTAIGFRTLENVSSLQLKMSNGSYVVSSNIAALSTIQIPFSFNQTFSTLPVVYVGNITGGPGGFAEVIMS